jgi:hypothetical protein
VKVRRFQSIAFLFLFFAIAVSTVTAQSARWSEQRANEWYAQQPWLVGSNYIPKSAINELEMWQAETFDPSEIDKELGWAEAMGMNTMRVFLHDLLWQQDAPGFRRRLNQFLSFAPSHTAAARAIRLLLGSSAASRSAARPSPRRPQFRMGAEPRCESSRRSG